MGRELRPVVPGLKNLGETCFLNSLLQVSWTSVGRRTSSYASNLWHDSPDRPSHHDPTCLVQALASSRALLSYLQRTVAEAGPSSSDLLLHLLECLMDLGPGPHRQAVNPGPVVRELR